MHSLYLLRHAKSSWDDETLADHDRPLAPRGVRDARRMGLHLGGLAVQPDLVLCSSSVRTRETLDLIGLEGDPDVQFENGLYAASADAILDRLRRVTEPVQTVLVIGHNPGLQDLTLRLDRSGAAWDDVGVKFPTCALAGFELPGTWSRLEERANLVQYMVPKRLP
jgi:phosphohistidine phosphatase